MESNDSDPPSKEVLQSRKINGRKSRAVTTNRSVKTVPVSNPLDAKWIRVYVNGDEHFSGFKCVVNSKYYRNFDSFLSYLTERLRPGFGAVRNIYTPISGHCIRSLEELQANQKYVVAGSEKFRKLEPGYADIGVKTIKKNEPKPTFKRRYSATKFKPRNQNPVTLYFYKNGVQRTKPLKMVLHTKDLENFDKFFDQIKYRLRCGQIKRLYWLNGKPINNPSELQNEEAYVVVEKYDVFKALNYGTHPVKTRQVVKEDQKRAPSCGNSKHAIETDDSRQDSIETDNSVQQDGVELDKEREDDTVKLVMESENKNEGPDEKDINDNILNSSKTGHYKFFSSGDGKRNYAPSATYELSFQVKELDLDVDLGGVYRAKEMYCVTEGAKEIQDDVETAVEIIPDGDELDAEEVEDEEEENEEEELTPDMERSMQHLTLDPPEELVAYLPSMQGKISDASNERASSGKHNLSESQTLGSQNIFAQ